MAKVDVDWKMEHELAKDNVVKVHGHDFGFFAYVGYDANQETPIRTLRLMVTEPNKFGAIKPVRDKDFESGKAVNWQLVMPDDVKFLKALGNFALEYAKHLTDQYKEIEKEAVARAKAATA